MDLTSSIGKWKRYPETRELFEATFFVYFKNHHAIELQINLNPNSPLGTAYSITVELEKFRKFIFALKTGRNLTTISNNGFLRRKFKIKGKYTISETVYLWKIPVGYQMFTISFTTANALFKDFCET